MKMKTLFFYGTRPVLGARRLALAWHEWRHPDEPWIAQGATAFLKQNLNQDMNLFEWGSGRSTAWFAKLCKSVVSIEYNEEWSQKVRKQLMKEGTDNAKVLYLPLEHDKSLPTPEYYDPIPKYVSSLFEYSKEHFHCIVVDGHYRLTCVAQCKEYLKPGGFLVIDNSNRVPRDEWAIPIDWPQVHQSENAMTETTIWQKPILNS